MHDARQIIDPYFMQLMTTTVTQDLIKTKHDTKTNWMHVIITYIWGIGSPLKISEASQ